MKKNILIAGASGGIGKEFTKLYCDDPNVEKVIELDLSAEEKNNFDNSIKAVKELFDAAKKIDPDLQ